MNQIILFLSFFLVSTGLFAQRQEIPFNQSWKFKKVHSHDKTEEVNIPHCWNVEDALDPVGRKDYFRGLCEYKKTFKAEESWKDKTIYVKFEGVNNVADVFVNDKYVGQHKGGYTAFSFDITPYLYIGNKNEIKVKVNNAWRVDVTPLSGDFNIYGGIYRPVHLMVMERSHISPMDFGSSGVYITQRKVNEEVASLQISTVVRNGSAHRETLEIEHLIKDHEGNIVFQKRSKKHVYGLQTESILMPAYVKTPHLWNGKSDPYLYSVTSKLYDSKGNLLDEIVQNTGFRYFQFDSEQGFSLNGKKLQLKGVNRHQDHLDKGYALDNSNHDEDIALMNEMGVNAIRLAHYPQAKYLYEQCDQEGMVVWAEIPVLEYVENEGFKENARQQLTELIRQNYNSPSIVTWGFFNEFNHDWARNCNEFVIELNKLAHGEDPSRYTTGATHNSGEYNFVTDILAWNKYFGWYGSDPKEFDRWIEEFHKNNPNIPVGISEYGAGASIEQHQEEMKKPKPGGKFHPEEWQTYFHEVHWKSINSKPYIWGSFVWNMFDFGAAHRTEGDTFGRNDKGLVTIDRKTKKDAFYFYKANWNKKDHFVYLAERRMINRTKELTAVKVFTNLSKAKLYINGKSVGTQKSDFGACVWENVKLKVGKNSVKVVGVHKGDSFTDEVIWDVQRVSI